MNTKVKGESYVSHPVVSLRLAIDRWLKSGAKTSIALIATMCGALLLTLIPLVVFAGVNLASSIDGNTVDKNALLSFLPILLVGIIVIVFAILVPLTIALDYVFVNSQNNLSIAYKTAVRRGYRRLLAGLGAYILAVLMVIVGLVLLIIPGIYIALRLAYLNSVIANEDLGPVQSIKRAFALTKNHLWDIVGVISLSVIVSSVLSLLLTGFEALAKDNAFAGIVTVLLTIISIVAGLFVAQGTYFRYHQSALEKESKLTKEGTDKMNYILLVGAILLTSLDGSTAKDTPSFKNFEFEDSRGSV